MDPQPSNKVFSASEVWSNASSTVIDTRSEPIRPSDYGRDPRTQQCVGASPAAPAPVAPKKHSAGSDASVQSSRDPEPSAVAGGARSVATAKSAKPACSSSRSSSRSSQPQAGKGHPVAGAAPPGSSSNRKSGRASSPGSVARYSSVSSRQSSSRAPPVDQLPQHARERGPVPGGGRSSHARDPDNGYVPQSNGIDPPESASRTGSSGRHQQPHLDPPSCTGTAPSYTESQSQEPSAGVYQSKSSHTDTLAVWNEEFTASMGGTLRSPRVGSRTDAVSSRSPSPPSRSSGSAEGSTLATSVEQALALRADNVAGHGGGSRAGGSRTAASSRGDASRASSRGSRSRAAASRSTFGSAAPRGDGGDEDRGASRALARSPRDLVPADHHDEMERYYDEEEEHHHDGALVARDDRYLSAAVDNHQAMVPIDSNIYEAYDHTFVTCPERLRFRFLYTFIKNNMDKKVMIFFSTSNSVKFHAKLLNHFHIPVITMHDKQPREKFIHRFFRFSDMSTGILCATDAAGRDLDIPPSVDWVVQFEPPDDPSEYILRVARISCDADRVGRSLLFLNPGEQGFLKYYHSASIPVSEFEIPHQKLAAVQGKIECIVNENDRMLRASRDAYGSYLIAHASHGFRDVYNVHDLNKHDVASSFGLVGLPCADDMTMETDTIAGRSVFGSVADRGAPEKTGPPKKATWDKKEKANHVDWMKGGTKSWPHSQIKLHPKFHEK